MRLAAVGLVACVTPYLLARPAAAETPCDVGEEDCHIDVRAGSDLVPTDCKGVGDCRPSGPHLTLEAGVAVHAMSARPALRRAVIDMPDAGIDTAAMVRATAGKRLYAGLELQVADDAKQGMAIAGVSMPVLAAMTLGAELAGGAMEPDAPGATSAVAELRAHLDIPATSAISFAALAGTSLVDAGAWSASIGLAFHTRVSTRPAPRR